MVKQSEQEISQKYEKSHQAQLELAKQLEEAKIQLESAKKKIAPEVIIDEPEDNETIISEGETKDLS